MSERKDACLVRVSVTERAKGALDALCERRGMTQKAALSRLVEWIAGQPWEVQVGVLQEGRRSDGRPDPR